MESKSNCGQSEDNISVNESTNEIHFNASINSKSISTLITKLLHMEEQILKKTKTLKRKIDKLEELKLNPPTGTKVIPLNVDAAFHTSYMRPAISEFKEVFNDIEIRFPEQLILTNKNGEFVKEKSDIVENLVNQIISPVRWDLCQKQFISNGVTGMLELSPGGTLTGIAKKGLIRQKRFWY